MKSAVLFLLKFLRVLKVSVEKQIERLESVRIGRTRIAGSGVWSRDVRLPSYYADFAVLALLAAQSRLLAHDTVHFLSLVFYSAGMYGVFAYALKISSAEICVETSSYLLLIFLMLVNLYSLFIAEIAGAVYLFPTTAVVFTAALLFPKNVSVIFGIFSLLVCQAFLPSRHWYFLPSYVLSAAAAVMLAAPVTTRKAMITAGFKMSLVNTVIFAFSKELFNQYISAADIYYALASGILASAVSLIFLPYLEAIFGRMSPISIVEMSDTNKPLLKQMMVDAPGTYHHSLITASLAEAACDAIGASGPLARVGAYYHDIGKLFKPEYFIENQIYSGNPHDTVSPTMSGMVLMAHVKEGVDIAHKNKLNGRIIDFIEEHHGTSLIIQFYHKAVIKDISVQEKDFRYNGIKPHSRETAVVMLADSVEAASRSLSALKPSAIADTVRKVINNKFVDGQLNSAPLTLRDIETVTEVMTRTLCGILHVRYQKQEEAAAAELKPAPEPRPSPPSEETSG